MRGALGPQCPGGSPPMEGQAVTLLPKIATVLTLLVRSSQKVRVGIGASRLIEAYVEAAAH